MAFHFPNVLAEIEKHPLITGLTVFAIGYGVLAVTGVLGGGSSAGDAATASYFNASSAQAQAGDALQIAQINAQAGVATTALNDTAATNIATTYAGAATTQGAQQVQETQSLIPVLSLASIASAIASVAAIPPVTSQTSSKNSGFFGIGASSSTTTSVNANPNATSAENELDAILASFENLGSSSTTGGLNVGS